MKGFVYKIVNGHSDHYHKVYIGSTTHDLETRFSRHKSKAKTNRFIRNKLYNLMNDIGHEYFEITELASFEIGSNSLDFIVKEKLKKHEQLFIDEFPKESLLNSMNSTASGSQNFEFAIPINLHVHETYKKYHDDYNKSYYKKYESQKTKCSCGSSYNRFTIANHRSSRKHINHMRSSKHMRNLLDLGNSSSSSENEMA
jgi:hypothetical protein